MRVVTLVPDRPFRTGDRVVVLSVGQRGVVRGRKDGRVLVHFGTQNKVEAWSWFPTADIIRDADMIEVILP